MHIQVFIYIFGTIYDCVRSVVCLHPYHITVYFLKTRILPYNLVQFSRWGNLTLIQYSYPAHVHIQNVISCSSDAPRWGGGGLVPEQVVMAVDAGSQVTRQQL